MSETVSSIQSKISAIVDQSTTAPTDSTDEYALRLSFINRAIEEFNNAYDFEILRKIQYVSITGVSQGSISLPMDFRKMAAFPRVWSTGVSTGEEWSQINPETSGQYDVSDHYYYILGNRGAGYTMIWNPATLASGATLQIQYFSYATSLASPADNVVLDSTNFVVDRTIAYIFQTRNDTRYRLFEQSAREALLINIDNQNDKSRAFGVNNYVGVTINKLTGFRMGRD